MGTRTDEWNRFFKDLHGIGDCLDEWDYKHGITATVWSVYNAVEDTFMSIEEDSGTDREWEEANDILDALGRYTIIRNKQMMRICFTAEFVDMKEALINLHNFGKEI